MIGQEKRDKWKKILPELGKIPGDRLLCKKLRNNLFK